MDTYDYWMENINERDELKKLTAEERAEAFYKDLEFGTGGLRGIIGLGTNRINRYTVRKATQGLSEEIKTHGQAFMEKGVVIAFDSRNKSDELARETANVLYANGIKVYLFESLRPTPELSFAVRYLGCARGIVITASHNPKEYNGYKVYGEDGGQIPPGVAEIITKHIKSIDIFADIKLCKNPKINVIGKEIDNAYLDAVYEQSLHTEIPKDFRIVYTPLHGAGNLPVRDILNKIGAKNVFVVPEQEKPNGDFPTVNSPNPENSEAFTLAIDYAKKSGADLILGTDPDSDRIGVVIKTEDKDYKVLNGNQTGILLCEFLLRKLNENGSLDDRQTIIKTIVTTELVPKIASRYHIDTIDVLTGFKYIGEKIKEFEKNRDQRFLFGLEESYGYLKGTYARDKDAVVAAMLICEMAADYKKKKMTLYDGLLSIYKEYGFSCTKLVTKTYEGIEGSNKIRRIMDSLRNGNLQLNYKEVIDYIAGKNGLPKSNVLKCIFDDGWVAVRPSGTEPKIKLYFETYAHNRKEAEKRMEYLVNEMEKCLI